MVLGIRVYDVLRVEEIVVEKESGFCRLPSRQDGSFSPVNNSRVRPGSEWSCSVGSGSIEPPSNNKIGIAVFDEYELKSAGLSVAVLIYFLRASHANLQPLDPLEKQCGPVIYLNAMWRHGARNIEAVAPKDPYADVKYWPGGLGALTNQGILQHYRLGKWIAKRYHHLLPEDNVNINGAVKTMSTDWNRTEMSAQAEMAAMFPTHNSVYWEGITSYPVPIHSIPEEDDALLEVTKKCDKYEALMNATKNSQKYQQVLHKYPNMTQYVEDNAGIIISNLDDYQNLYTNCYIEEDRGFKLPDWLKKVYPSPMKELVIVSFVAPTWDDELKRFRGGPFVKEVLNNFRGKLDGSNLLNMSLYSAHDTSLSAAMNTMGVFNDAVPPFAALLLLELRMPHDSSTPVVSMWYKNSTKEPFLLEMPGCGSCCPLEQMEQQLKPVIPEDWEKECQDNTEGAREIKWKFNPPTTACCGVELN
ncbi:hypothetical protein GE061_010676 [Apolygus lucorum]|uniref:acid phosphatase n=1 Tax=Apolygus lucorum TaxID=248454 RepID=A0A8S9XVL1_APOLU|nr:hypothetical protein GE061_010676 [Apolygus lucorum]